MSDTPETDSYWDCWDRSASNHDDRDKEFARRLERERDAARQKHVKTKSVVRDLTDLIRSLVLTGGITIGGLNMLNEQLTPLTQKAKEAE